MRSSWSLLCFAQSSSPSPAPTPNPQYTTHPLPRELVGLRLPHARHLRQKALPLRARLVESAVPLVVAVEPHRGGRQEHLVAFIGAVDWGVRFWSVSQYTGLIEPAVPFPSSQQATDLGRVLEALDGLHQQRRPVPAAAEYALLLGVRPCAQPPLQRLGRTGAHVLACREWCVCKTVRQSNACYHISILSPQPSPHFTRTHPPGARRRPRPRAPAR